MSEAKILDVLIAGGGPGGIATACRARELGLSALVIEYDDLMKRIRDYSKDKLILPSFGGGDRMRFPQGAELISALQFGPIDKDEMCSCWKGLCREHGLDTRVGVELTGLERENGGDGGLYRVLGWDHARRTDVSFLVRHVVIAIGRGVPRRFDVPGDTEGIAFRLTDPTAYVGCPACVIGGGTSAAEAVIALSAAKAAAGDPTAVYWSYRGDRMPRVSKALAEVFFEAYVGNGNIRYYPKSEPAAVVTGEDRREYLAIRVDRRHMEGRPIEVAQLEFPKECCVACIGEDLPATLLQSLGIPMVVGGPRNRKRMVVNRLLESARENVYLVGDILSQAYFETEDFDADPATFREVKHRGNIKSALRDGVRVAQIIAQRLAGADEIDAGIEDAEDRYLEDPLSESLAPSRSMTSSFISTMPSAEDGPPAASLEPGREAAEPEPAAYLIRVLPGGVEEDEHPLANHGVLTIGRRDCDVTIADDTLLSDRHASVSHTDDGFFLRDDGSAGGVFLRLPVHRKLEVQAGDLLCAGRQFLLIDAAGGDGGIGELAFRHFDAEGRELRRHPIPGRSIVVGRRAPDVILDPADKSLSRRQLAISSAGGKVLVKDLKSVNGTYLRVRSAIRLEQGDRFRVGHQHFVFTLSRDAVLDSGPVSTVQSLPVPAAEPAAAAAAAPAADVPVDGAPSVTFQPLGQTFPVAPGQTLCDVAESNGVKLSAECHAGICGSDPIRILTGRDNLVAEAGDEEADTLEDICGLKAGECRLACMARIKGPITVEIL